MKNDSEDLQQYFKHINTEISDDIKKFVREDVFRYSEYLFIKKVNGIGRAYCSKCNKEFDVISCLKHNMDIRCPECGAHVQVKFLRYKRGNCYNEACFYWFEKSIVDPEVITCRGYYVTKDYAADYKNPKIDYDLQAIYIFSKQKSVMLKEEWGYNLWPNSMGLTRTIFDFNQGWLAPKMCYCSFESLDKAVKGTSYQYLPYKPFEGHYSMVKLFDEYSRHPGIEYLIKEGFSSLVASKIKGCCLTHGTINWSGENIFEILKINKADLRQIRSKEIYVTFIFLKIFQDSKKYHWGLSVEEVKKISDDYSYSYNDLRKIAMHTSIKKTLKYIKKQYKEFNGEKNNRRYFCGEDVITTFNDYIQDCKTLNMDLKKEQILFPKDLYKAHQHLTKQIKIKENKKYDVLIKARVKSLEKYNFQDDKYLIRPAASCTEIIEEGSKLNHCVATHYLIPHAEGKTNILFVRKRNNPDKPYCTVEVKDNEVRQAYIKNDIVPDKETLNFIEKFKKATLIVVNKKARISA